MKIEVGFSKAKGFAPEGWIVMWLERTKFSHAYVRIYLPEYDRSIIYQATGLTVQFQSEQAFALKSLEVEKFAFEVQPDDVQRLMQWAIDNCGKPYSYKEAIGLGLKRIARRLGFKIKNPWAEKDAFVCCTLVAEALHWAGIAALNSPDEIDLVSLSKFVRNYSIMKKNSRS